MILTTLYDVFFAAVVQQEERVVLVEGRRQFGGGRRASGITAVVDVIVVDNAATVQHTVWPRLTGVALSGRRCWWCRGWGRHLSRSRR